MSIKDLDYNADITVLRGADYNPRQIGQDDLDRLASSIKTIGLVKPLIVRGDLLVAGHQRTKALRAIGVETAPVYRLPVDTSVYDEVRFNQLHNGTDMDCGDEECRITGGFDDTGWHTVSPDRIEANMHGRMVSVRNEICSMLVSYGPWGGVVATRSGEVFHAAQYALACRATRTPLTVYVMPDELVEQARDYLGRQYGVFSYDRLEKQTYIQTLAQMYRLKSGPSGKKNRSMLYENLVIPWLEKNPGARAIDFGSGFGDYAAALRGRGLDVHDVELFRRNRRLGLNETAIQRMISRMCSDLTYRGQYDAVVMDSVLNSVDCLEAEKAVMTVINMLAKVGGDVFISGRMLERVESQSNFRSMKMGKQKNRLVEFLDKDGFTALYRNGRWFYQKFHSEEDAAALVRDYGFEVVHQYHGKYSTTSWQMHLRKVGELEMTTVEWACDYEFNLALGDEKTINRHEDVKRAVRASRNLGGHEDDQLQDRIDE